MYIYIYLQKYYTRIYVYMYVYIYSTYIYIYIYILYRVYIIFVVLLSIWRNLHGIFSSRSSHRPTAGSSPDDEGDLRTRNDGETMVSERMEKTIPFLKIRSWLKKTFLIKIEVFFRIPSLTDWCMERLLGMTCSQLIEGVNEWYF